MKTKKAELSTEIMKKICKNCFYYGKPNKSMNNWGGDGGNCGCPKFVYGYNLQDDDYPKTNDWIHIEDDEGWGCYVSDNFGCIHFKRLN